MSGTVLSELWQYYQSQEGSGARRSSNLAYGLHAASGQARVIIGGRTIYLGKYGSPESHERYAREVARAAAVPPVQSALRLHEPAGADLAIDELLLRYLPRADGYYCWNGDRSKEFRSTVEAVGLLRQLYGSTSASEFGPRPLKNIQAAALEKGWCRRTINSRINRIHRVFQRGVVSEELLCFTRSPRSPACNSDVATLRNHDRPKQSLSPTSISLILNHALHRSTAGSARFIRRLQPTNERRISKKPDGAILCTTATE